MTGVQTCALPISHVTGGGLPGNVPRTLPAALGARLDPATWPVPSVIRMIGALARLSDAELRATFNAGLGMVLVVPPDAAGPTVELARGRGIPAWVVGEVVEASALGGDRYVEGPLGA